MPISPINFITNNPQGYGPGDLLGSIMEGYKAAKLPGQMRQEEAQKRELIKQLMLGNEKAVMENQYLPNKLRQEEEKRRLANETGQLNLNALPQDIQARQLAELLKNQGAQKDLDWADRLNQAKIDQARAALTRATGGTPERRTVLAKNLEAAGFPPGTPEYEDAARLALNLPPKSPLPKDVIPLAGKSPGERQLYLKDMNADIERSDAAGRAIDTANEMLKILKDNPEMSDWLTTDLFDPEARQTVFNNLVKKRIFQNKEKRATLQKFNKLAADLVLEQTTLNGGSAAKATDDYRGLVAQSKPQVGYENKSNEFVLERFINKNTPLSRYAKDARQYKKKGYVYLYDPDDYSMPTIPTPPVSQDVPTDLSGFMEQ